MIVKKSLQLPLVVLCFIAFLININLTVHAQTVANASVNNPTLSSLKFEDIQPLAIGDKVPDIVLKNAFNYPSKSIRLSDFRGKLLILDFWSTWCTSCIEGFPKMQELQKKFDKDIQILLVDTDSGDTKEKVQTSFGKREQRTGFSVKLPYSLQQAQLKEYFPHLTVPHFVWVDMNGVVIGITHKADVSEKNIQAVLSGQTVKFRLKNDFPDYDPEKPLYVEGNGGQGDDFVFRSILTRHKPELGSYMGKTPEEDNKISRIYIVNYALYQLFQIAYIDLFKYPSNRVLIEVQNPELFKLSQGEETDYSNYYCYEIITPPRSWDEIITFMQDDLYRMFHTRVKNEIRTVSCYVLTKNDQIQKTLTKGGTAESDVDRNSLKKFMRNQPISRVTNFLNRFLAEPLLDETGITGNIDIDFPNDFYEYDFKQIIDFFRAKGFELIKTSRSIEITVITDKKS